MSGTGDHYKVLGLNKNATKDEIKEAFRKLAIKYHPDKHSQSPKPVRENATLRFKLASEAYEVLSDDRKRADYNIRSRSTGSYYGNTNGYNRYSYNNNYNNSYSWNGKAYQARYTKRPPGSGSSDFVSRFEFALRLLTTRAFLLNLGFAGALVGGMFLIDSSMDSMWKTQNSGMNERYIIENTAENLLLQPQSYTHASQTKQNKLHPGSSRDNTSALQPRTKIPEKQQTMQEASEYITQAFLVRADTEIPQHQHKKSFEEALESIEKTKGSQKSPREAFESIERVRAYKAMKSTEKAKAISENNRRVH